MSTLWPAFYMNMTDQFPRPCELVQLTALAVLACDELDGVKYGLIGETEECRTTVDPHRDVGDIFYCEAVGSDIQITQAAANESRDLASVSRFLFYCIKSGNSCALLIGIESVESK
jgi:hypothetical protein